MTEEQRNLLMKDLCSRLPYGVKFVIDNGQNNIRTLTGIDEAIPYENWQMCACAHGISAIPIEYIKPYLFPMSSMTEEQEYEWDNLFTDPLCERVMSRHTREKDLLLRAKSGSTSTDYLDKNFFDHRGLIPMGLALDATGLNIY